MSPRAMLRVQLGDVDDDQAGIIDVPHLRLQKGDGIFDVLKHIDLYNQVGLHLQPCGRERLNDDFNAFRAPASRATGDGSTPTT